MSNVASTLLLVWTGLTNPKFYNEIHFGVVCVGTSESRLVYDGGAVEVPVRSSTATSETVVLSSGPRRRRNAAGDLQGLIRRAAARARPQVECSAPVNMRAQDCAIN